MANNTPADNITVATMTVKGITRYSGEPYNGVVNANVIFKPYSALGDIWVDRSQVPVVIQSVEGIIQNGVLKDKTGNTGVKLYASTPEGDSNIAHNQWTAIFLDVTVDGIPALMNEIVFDAKSNEYVDLVDYVPVPLKNDAGLIRGPRGTIIESFTIEGSELIVWERAKDGSLVKIDSVDISHFATESARIASEEALANLEQTLINHKESSSREANRARDEADRAAQAAAASSVKAVNNRVDELMEGALPAFDTLREIGEELSRGQTAETALTQKIADKVDKSTTPNVLYGTGSEGEQYSYPIVGASSPAAYTVPLRTVGGAIRVGTPTSADHATTKTYVDGEVFKVRSEIPKPIPMQVVTTLPTTPDPNVLYFVTG